MSTITLQLINPQVLGLLYELQKNNMIRVVSSSEEQSNNPIRLSEKYKGSISREKGEELLNHIETIRNEWRDTFIIKP